MKVLLTTCLLFTLLPAVASLKCQQCLGKKKACDNPPEIECAEDEDSCLSASAQLSLGSFTLMTVSAKTCVESKYIATGYDFLGTDHSISIIAQGKICQTDQCNNKTISLPHHSELPENGRECPACLTLDSDRCEAQKTIPCRGNEIKCLYVGIIGEGPVHFEYNLALRGCASESLCVPPTGEMEIAGGMLTINITHLECTNAPMSPSALEGFAPHLLWRLPFMGMKQRPQGPGWM